MLSAGHSTKRQKRKGLLVKMKGVRKVEHVTGHSTEVRRIKQMNKKEEIEK